MSIHPRSRRLLAAAMAAGMVLGACSDDDGEADISDEIEQEGEELEQDAEDGADEAEQQVDEGAEEDDEG